MFDKYIAKLAVLLLAAISIQIQAEEVGQKIAQKNGESGEESVLAETGEAEILNENLSEEDLEILEEEVAADSAADEAAESVEEVSAIPPAISEIGGLKVPEDDWSQGMVRKYIMMYTTERGQKTLFHILNSGEEYRIYIRKKLAEYSLPPTLEYLPVVESEYRPTATSKSGARGLWQFMENSIKPYLKKNDWIDERLDPWKSTDAALKKLQENYKAFGDWALALAAYNCGAGLVAKTVKEHPGLSYWELAEQGFLKKETVHYVPKLLGVTELSENPEKYGITLPKIADDAQIQQYDYATARKPVSLAKLAAALDLSIKTVKRLNPALVRTVTPPSTGFQVRLPLGMKDAGQEALDKIQSEMKGDALLYVEHKITQGDTLWGLSRTYGCKVDDICDLNGITQKTTLRLGKILYIPMK